jgi:hypothetical protein
MKANPIKAQHKFIISRQLLSRLFSKIHISETVIYNNIPCWEWTAFISRNGYAQYGLKIEGKAYTFLTHRLMYTLFVESIPDGLIIDHLCRNTRCVNPIHLEATTSKVNTARGIWQKHRGPALVDFCKHGHEMTGDNVQIGAWKRNRLSQVRRYCRECRRLKQRRYVARKRERLHIV